MKKYRLLSFLLCFITVFLGSFTGAYSYSFKPSVTDGSITLPMQSPYSENHVVDNRYMVVMENIHPFSHRFTIIDMYSMKVLKTYYKRFPGQSWPIWGWYDNNDNYGRYWLGTTYDKKNKYYFLFDSLTGTTTDITKYRTDAVKRGISKDGSNIYFTYLKKGQSPEDPNRRLLFLNMKTSQKLEVEDARLEESHFSGMLSRTGKYAAYTKDNTLFIIDFESMKQTKLSENTGEGCIFLDWLPMDKGILFSENGIIKSCDFAGNIKELGIYSLSSKHSEFQSYNNTYFNVNWNNDSSRAVIDINRSDYVYCYDNASSVLKSVYVNDDPGIETRWPKKFFTSDKKGRPDIIGSNFLWMDGVYKLTVLNGNSSKELKVCAKSIEYYKDSIVFLSDLERIGNCSTDPHSVSVYNYITGQLRVIPNAISYYINPDESSLFIYDEKGANIWDDRKFNLGPRLKNIPNTEYGGSCGIDFRLYRGDLVPVKKMGQYLFSKDLLALRSTEISDKDVYKINKDFASYYIAKRKCLYTYKNEVLSFLKINETPVPDKSFFNGYEYNSGVSFVKSDPGHNVVSYFYNVKNKMYFRMLRLKV